MHPDLLGFGLSNNMHNLGIIDHIQCNPLQHNQSELLFRHHILGTLKNLYSNDHFHIAKYIFSSYPPIHLAILLKPFFLKYLIALSKNSCGLEEFSPTSSSPCKLFSHSFLASWLSSPTSHTCHLWSPNFKLIIYSFCIKSSYIPYYL